ncbi:MAG: DUF4174 domain-containing protein [Pseudomonadota bacterium]
MHYRIAALLSIAAFSAAPLPAAAGPLSEYVWSHRPLLLFADAADAPALLRQREILAPHRDGLRDRAVPVIIVSGDRVEIDGAPSEISADRLRQRYDAPMGGFSAVLIGKDSGVKLTRTEPVSADALFALIDAMPMRRRELRERSQNQNPNPNESQRRADEG